MYDGKGQIRSSALTMLPALGQTRGVRHPRILQSSKAPHPKLRRGRVTAAEWNARDVECLKCGKMVKATSLRRHLADMHNVYQQTVVAEEMLICRPAETYVVSESSPAGLWCPFPECGGLLQSGWMMRRHFRDVHPKDLVKVPKEGKYRRCTRCGMQVDPRYPRHQFTKECQVGVERRKQREAAVTSALALRQQFTVHGEALERVEVFKYLGRLLAQDDDDIQAIRAQLRKARATWAHVGQVLRAEKLRLSSTRRWFRPCYSTAAKRGSSRRPLWQVSRGSTSVQPTEWR